jgi:hypothetical protein
VESQETDEQHPRISALRGIAAAQRLLGGASEGAACRDRCVQVAVSASEPMYRLLGLMGLGDSLVAGEPCDDSLQRLWTESTGARTTEDTQRILERWVY